ncbi:hypothetical protein ARMGADRAFT_476663 [Armillaria gallica]|uniref:Uncharacterized protein n=1 Tax=Armillaria gallica TaxID=47427 RepID=A0A2H3CVJ2_ARMGA|nr:hypothetical protein ARMGADRAFT_476663 [Armillaria gallica]
MSRTGRPAPLYRLHGISCFAFGQVWPAVDLGYLAAFIPGPLEEGESGQVLPSARSSASIDDLAILAAGYEASATPVKVGSISFTSLKEVSWRSIP